MLLTLRDLQGCHGRKKMLCKRACGVVLEGWGRVVREGGRLRRSRLALLRLRDGNVGERRRRLDLRSRGGRLRLRVRGLRCEWAYVLAGNDVEGRGLRGLLCHFF